MPSNVSGSHIVYRTLALAALLTFLGLGVNALADPNSPTHRLVRRHGAHRHGEEEEVHAEANESNTAECGQRLNLEDYNEPLHIAAIFILLITSAVAVFGALFAGRARKMRVYEHVLNVFKHFGTGVILATGFIHILPEAMEALSDPCLAGLNAHFSTWGPFFIMVAILLMQLIEFIAGEQARRYLSSAARNKSAGHKHHGHSYEAVAKDGNKSVDHVTDAPSTTPSPATSHSDAIAEQPAITATGGAAEAQAHTHAHDELHDHHGHAHAHAHADAGGHACHDVAALLDRDSQMRISTYILELGIALHSVLIGLTLGVASGSTYVTLLVAIVFHQFFEGVALGSRIAEVMVGQRALKAYVLATIFAVITPIGAAIGMGIRTSYSPRSPAALLSYGIMDAFSAGVLIYMALVNLLAEEFTNCRKFHERSGRVKVLYYAALYLGAAAMTVIGRWA